MKRAGEIELAGVDLVCLAVPSAALPAAVGSLGDRIGSRAAVLMLTKGLVQPLGQLPSDYVGERIRARAIASLGGPAHAREAAAGMAALVLGSSDAGPAGPAGRGLRSCRAGLRAQRRRGRGRDGGRRQERRLPWRGGGGGPRPQCRGDRRRDDLARVRRVRAGAAARELDTFTGLAGVGDLTATVIAPGSRNRRAGELLGAGVAADQIPGRIGQASEGLDSVPLLAEVDGPGRASRRRASTGSRP